MDPPILPGREKGPFEAFFALQKLFSKTRMDKTQPKTPTRRGKITQQKRHFVRSAFLNGRGGGIRTHDLTVPNRARYHLRYAPYNSNQMVGKAGIEPAISRTPSERSTSEPLPL